MAATKTLQQEWSALGKQSASLGNKGLKKGITGKYCYHCFKRRRILAFKALFIKALLKTHPF